MTRRQREMQKDKEVVVDVVRGGVCERCIQTDSEH